MAGRAGTKGRETAPPEQDTWIARMALRFTDFTERWMPDAFIFALLGTVIVIVAAYLVAPRSAPSRPRWSTPGGPGSSIPTCSSSRCR